MSAEPLPYADFTSATLKLYAPPMRASATRKKMRAALESLAVVGVETTAQLTTQKIAAWLALRAEGNVNTTLSLLAAIRTACLYAVEEGWLERPPSFDRVWPRRTPSRRKLHLSYEQVCTLLDHLSRQAGEGWREHRLHALTALAAYTGVRLHEALFVQLDDLELDRRLLWISARHRLKTEGSAAPVPLPRELVPILAKWLPEAHAPWLFPGVTRSGPWHGGAPGYRPLDWLKKAGAECGIGPITFHSLRHTLAKLLIHKFGQTGDQVKSMLRHESIRTTEEHYLHRDDLLSLLAIVERVSFRPQT